MAAASKHSGVQRTTHMINEVPFHADSKPIYSAGNMRIYGDLNQQFGGVFYVVFITGANGSTVAHIFFRHVCLSNSIGHGKFPILFLRKNGTIMDKIDVDCVEYAFENIKTLFVEGDEAAAAAVDAVLSATEPHLAKRATEPSSGFKPMAIWDTRAAHEAMQDAINAQLYHCPSFFNLLKDLERKCKSIGGADTTMRFYEASRDPWQGCGIDEVTLDGELTAEFVAKHVPITADGTTTFTGENLLGIILEVMAVIVGHYDSYEAMWEEIVEPHWDVKVAVSSKRAASEEP